MAAVPIILNGVLMPKGKSASDKPVPACFIGYASIAGLEVGGGPIIPETPPDPPVVEPPDPPPTEGGGVAIVIKPAPVTGGWGLATKPSGELSWFWTPGSSGAGPKK